MNSNSSHHQQQRKRAKLDYFIGDNLDKQQQQQQQQVLLQQQQVGHIKPSFNNGANKNEKNQMEILFDPGINIDDYYGDGDGDDDDEDDEFENYDISNTIASVANNGDGSLNLGDGSGKKTRKGNKNKKTKGRVKIRMEYIENKIRRYTTFSKRKTGIMKKAYELSTLTGTQVMLLVASETGHVYTFATKKFQPMITEEVGKNLIRDCLSSTDAATDVNNKPLVSNSSIAATVINQNIEIDDSTGLYEDTGVEEEDEDDESETIKDRKSMQRIRVEDQLGNRVYFQAYMRYIPENNSVKSDETKNEEAIYAQQQHKMNNSRNKLVPSYNNVKERTPPLQQQQASLISNLLPNHQQTLPPHTSIKTNSNNDSSDNQQILLSHSLLNQDNLIFNLTGNSQIAFSPQNNKFTNVNMNSAINSNNTSSNNPQYAYPVNVSNLNNSILVRSQRTDETTDVNR